MLLLRPGLAASAELNLELLLLRRANTGFMDGFFSLPGGHVEQHELPAAAVIRELQEEVGVNVGEAKPLAVLPYQSGRHLGYNFVFSATQWQGEVHLAEPQSADLLCWVPLSALPQPCAPWLHQVLQIALQAPTEQSDNWYQEVRY